MPLNLYTHQTRILRIVRALFADSSKNPKARKNPDGPLQAPYPDGRFKRASDSESLRPIGQPGGATHAWVGPATRVVTCSIGQ
jgi:hypothetical protein